MRAAVTFFGIKALAAAAKSTQAGVPVNTFRPAATLDYIALLSSGMLFPLHKLITIVLWNT